LLSFFPPTGMSIPPFLPLYLSFVDSQFRTTLLLSVSPIYSSSSLFFASSENTPFPNLLLYQICELPDLRSFSAIAPFSSSGKIFFFVPQRSPPSPPKGGGFLPDSPPPFQPAFRNAGALPRCGFLRRGEKIPLAQKPSVSSFSPSNSLKVGRRIGPSPPNEKRSFSLFNPPFSQDFSCLDRCSRFSQMSLPRTWPFPFLCCDQSRPCLRVSSDVFFLERCALFQVPQPPCALLLARRPFGGVDEHFSPRPLPPSPPLPSSDEGSPFLQIFPLFPSPPLSWEDSSSKN